MDRTVAIALIAAIAATSACKVPPEAPQELDELSRYLYREWDNEDPEVMQDGLSNLADFIATVDLDGGILDRSFEMQPPNEEDLAGVGRPEGADPSAMLGVSVARRSVWPTSDHARLQTEEDQTPTEPSAKEYVRSTEHADCFVPVDCPVMTSVNDIRRSNIAISVSMVLFKDFRWVELPEGQAMISRSWTDQVWLADGGDKGVFQSNSLDVWLPRTADETWRFQLVWSESEAGVGDNIALGTLKIASDDILRKGDDVIAELYHPEE